MELQAPDPVECERRDMGLLFKSISPFLQLLTGPGIRELFHTLKCLPDPHHLSREDSSGSEM